MPTNSTPRGTASDDEDVPQIDHPSRPRPGRRPRGELATTAEWKRAALVYARVHVRDRQGRPTEKVTNDLLIPAQYAERGIHGLRSKTTIRAYWRAWDQAITDGLAAPVSLGDEVEVPDAEWADYFTLHNHTTPPYYVPSKNAEPVPTHEVNAWNSQDTFQQRTRDNLGLGTCPPMASDIDEPEPRPLGPNGWMPVEGERPRPPAADQATERPPKAFPKLFTFYVRCVRDYAQDALDSIQGIDTFDDPQAVLECIERTRTALTAIERAVRGESLDEELDRLLDPGGGDG